MPISSNCKEHDGGRVDVLLAGGSGMRITSNLLGELGAVIKRAVIGPHETEMTVLPTIQPAASLRGIVRFPGAGSVTGSSFVVFTTVIASNNGPFSQNLVTVTPGLWEFIITAHYSSNYNSSVGAGIVRVSNGASVPSLMSFGSEIAGGENVTNMMKFQAAIDVNWTFQAFVTANAVGQSHNLQVTVIGMELIV